jgi:hypothetical protein
MINKDSLESYCNQQSINLFNLLSETFTNRTQESSKFSQRFVREFNKLDNEKQSKIRNALQLDEVEIARLVEGYLGQKIPEIMRFPITLPAPTLFSQKELQNLNLL